MKELNDLFVSILSALLPKFFSKYVATTTYNSKRRIQEDKNEAEIIKEILK